MFDTLSHNSSAEIIENKTQRQLCKRLAGPFIPFSWSCLVWKRVSLWLWSLGGSQQPFSSVLGHFRHGDDQMNEQPGDPSASLLLTSVRRQSFAICWKAVWIQIKDRHFLVELDYLGCSSLPLNPYFWNWEFSVFLTNSVSEQQPIKSSCRDFFGLNYKIQGTKKALLIFLMNQEALCPCPVSDI